MNATDLENTTGYKNEFYLLHFTIAGHEKYVCPITLTINYA